MKNTILAIALTLTGVAMYAQVGVGTQEPQTTLHVVGKNATSIAVGGTNTPGALDATDGITVPVVTTDMTAAPPAGTKISQLVYSTHASSTGYYYWNGSAWTAVGATSAKNSTAFGVDFSDSFTGTNNQTDYSAVTKNYIIATGSGVGSNTLVLPSAASNLNRVIVIKAAGRAVILPDTTSIANTRLGMVISDGTTWNLIRGN